MRRRTFFGAAFSGLALARPAKPKAGDIPTRTLGRTGQKLTIVGMGGARFHLTGFDEGVALVRRAHDLGINYFDMARSYWNGRAEEVYGAAIPAFRKSIFLTTKSGKRTRKEAEAELEQSLKLMKTDYVDLWQMHGVNKPEDIERIFAPGGFRSIGKQDLRNRMRWWGLYTQRRQGVPGERTGSAEPELHARLAVMRAIELRRETYPGVLNVTFTRGFVSSQAFVDRYESKGPISKLLPKKADEGLKFVPSHPKAKEALEWMGFEARHAILEVLDQAIADKKAQVRVVAYDLNEPGVVSRLEKIVFTALYPSATKRNYAGGAPSARISKRKLEEMIEVATVDCHNESEQITGRFAMID